MKNEKPYILITGVGGGLAQAVIERLKNNFQIIGVGFKERTFRDQDIIYHRADFSKRNFMDIFRKYTISGVIHLGRVLLYEWNRMRRYNTNVLGTQKIFDLCLKYNVQKVLVLSTFYVYGAHPFNPTLIDEMLPLKASNISADLADAVELENLASIYMLRYPKLNMTILRPCNIVGPDVQNSVSLLFSRKYAPCFTGYSPMMQFLHVEDLAQAISQAFEENHPGVYNVATEDWIPYQKALDLAGCKKIPLIPIPDAAARLAVKFLGMGEFPDFLLDYYKYPVILDGSRFTKKFKWTPKRTTEEIFEYYRGKKSL